MSSYLTLIHNRTVQIALGIVALMAAGSLAYYLIQSAPPAVAYATAVTGSVTEDVSATGIVSPLQNPTLSFETGGQVTSVRAVVGQKVAAGSLLASLDTGVLSANLQAALAQLRLLEAGPRAVDVAGQQTAVSNAQQSLTNLLNTYGQTLTSALLKTQNQVYTAADPLFNPNSTASSPELSFLTKDLPIREAAERDRANMTTTLNTWKSDLATIPSSPTPAQLHAITETSLSHLYDVRTFLADLTAAENDANVSTNYTQAQQTSALAALASASDTVNGLITSLTTADQSVASAQLAVQSANDQLSVANAGAKPQSIQAQQAQVASIEAQIRQLEIIAPFSGTISSVLVKTGDPVSANTPVITLIPNGTFQVEGYLAENQIAGLKIGDAVDVTLDAYGTNRIFPATVVSIDTSPSAQPGAAAGVMGYKVTVAFANADPAISNGMHANITIHAGSVTNAVLVPKSAVITGGTQSYVLQKTSVGLVKVPVTLGLSGTTTVQIVSGLSAGDTISAVGAQ
jgi:RND family efflux transporter MFP subunit